MTYIIRREKKEGRACEKTYLIWFSLWWIRGLLWRSRHGAGKIYLHWTKKFSSLIGTPLSK